MSAADEVARYIIPCLFRSPQIVDYHRELVDAIADRFGLTFTQRQRIPAHFTLKYHFTTSEIERVEELLGDLARTTEVKKGSGSGTRRLKHQREVRELPPANVAEFKK